MRNRDLHDALRNFALEAAALLSDEQSAGVELQFDLDEGATRRGPTLYHYRPLTGKFIADSWQHLRRLPSCRPACEALGAGAAAYLRVNGLHGAESEPALQAMLERLYEDATDFAFPEERFERVYEHVERTLFEKSQAATVLVPVYGLELMGERVDLGDGLALVSSDLTDAPEEAVWGDPTGGTEGSAGRPNALLMLTRDVTPDDPLPVAEARERFRRLLTGLRLWKPGGVALSGLAWRRTGDARWQPFEIEATGVARGEPWILVEGEEEELCEFLAAIDGSVRGGSVAWALGRLEMGLGRKLEAEALSDHLLGLRALLDPGADGSQSGLGLRVAVLCAEENDRKRTQRRVQLAMALERFVMGDGADDDYLDAIGSDSPRTLVNEVERHLRALLRDLMCGYLDPDLRGMADDLLLDQYDPCAARPHVPRTAPVTVAAQPAGEEPDGGPEHALDMMDEIEALEEEDREVEVHHAVEQATVAEIDPDPPWGDAESYSAPI